jgi:hypothetical protein
MPPVFDTTSREYGRTYEAKQRLSNRYFGACRRRWEADQTTAMQIHRSTHPLDNVVGIGVGERIRAGKKTRELCVMVAVRQKFHLDDLTRNHRLPRTLEGVPVDVIETGEFVGHFNPQVVVRPVVPGVSTSFVGSGVLLTSGTIGAIVTDGTDRYLLSCHHVFAMVDGLPEGTPIIQPGSQHHGNPNTDQVATLSRKIDLQPFGTNTVDCALARIDSGVATDTAIVEIGAPNGISKAAVMTVVEKYGCTSNNTTGIIQNVHCDTKVKILGRPVHFLDQILIKSDDSRNFSEEGDSGALVVNAVDGAAVGLLIGGSGNLSVANHIDTVLEQLGVRFA